jgi:selenocysteine lyase/cysteine desulfurase
VFCQANLLNFVPWTASVDYLLSQGIAEIQKHNDRLVEQLIKGLDAKNFAVLSPADPKDRTAIVIISHRHADRNPALFEVLKRERIDISLREGNLRFSPHLYNTPVEIDYAVSMLNRLR